MLVMNAEHKTLGPSTTRRNSLCFPSKMRLRFSVIATLNAMRRTTHGFLFFLQENSGERKLSLEPPRIAPVHRTANFRVDRTPGFLHDNMPRIRAPKESNCQVQHYDCAWNLANNHAVTMICSTKPGSNSFFLFIHVAICGHRFLFLYVLPLWSLLCCWILHSISE